eukprot:5056880-Pleurochrysis_carterae.AAC.1
MTMPSDGCALEMALRTVGSMHMSMLSQSSVHVAASDASCELVVGDFFSASVAESVEVWHGDGFAAEHWGHAFRGLEVVQ